MTEGVDEVCAVQRVEMKVLDAFAYEFATYRPPSLSPPAHAFVRVVIEVLEASPDLERHVDAGLFGEAACLAKVRHPGMMPGRIGMPMPAADALSRNWRNSRLSKKNCVIAKTHRHRPCASGSRYQHRASATQGGPSDMRPRRFERVPAPQTLDEFRRPAVPARMREVAPVARRRIALESDYVPDAGSPVLIRDSVDFLAGGTAQVRCAAGVRFVSRRMRVTVRWVRSRVEPPAP